VLEAGSVLQAVHTPRFNSSACCMHVLFLAKGTRGDVQPAALLATALHTQNPGITSHFITHADHKVGPSLLRELC